MNNTQSLIWDRQINTQQCLTVRKGLYCLGDWVPQYNVVITPIETKYAINTPRTKNTSSIGGKSSETRAKRLKVSERSVGGVQWDRRVPIGDSRGKIGGMGEHRLEIEEGC
ncbi:hypothetical protein L195_g013035 [Trifolium pratense]|uniref:Uncharacterized protein n=1 Tax=Trifolium pratense TaxID=57577 RepID=A0A2K3PM02_TRIPR|nr:hypothetical protein L195_g013035 [Trifolium pratense]